MAYAGVSNAFDGHRGQCMRARRCLLRVVPVQQGCTRMWPVTRLALESMMGKGGSSRACIAGKFAVLRVSPKRVVGLAVGADGPRARDSDCDRIHLHHLPADARVVRDHSLCFAQAAFPCRLGCARGAIPYRFRALDDEADTIRCRYSVPAEVI